MCIRADVFTAVTTRNAFFWDVAPCSYCKNQRFGGMYGLHHQSDKNAELGTTFAVTSNPRTLRSMIVATLFSLTSFLTRVIRRNIPEDDIFKIVMQVVHTLIVEDMRGSNGLRERGKMQWIL
jgi:hypothetical protein